MDDFEKEFPDFDWKNTPAYKHPGCKDCPCPKHEYIREQINFTKQVNEKEKNHPEFLRWATPISIADLAVAIPISLAYFRGYIAQVGHALRSQQAQLRCKTLQGIHQIRKLQGPDLGSSG